MNKIGFCCKYKAEPRLNPKEIKEEESVFNTKTTTVTALNKLTKKEVFKKLEPILFHNLEATKKIITYVSNLDERLKMMRLSSDLLPLYTHPVAEDFWFDSGIQKIISTNFSEIGSLLRKNNIRSGFHPGQFCVLNSADPRVLSNSIKEFEYHIDLARWMGYSQWHQDGFYCNVHVGGKNNGIAGLINNLPKLSKEALNLITIENDEYSFGVDEYLTLAPHVALVLDVHHHWCKTGEYISASDPRLNLIIESWRGIRPLLHYSLSQQELIPPQLQGKKLDLTELKSLGLKVSDLRAHSNGYWNLETNKWVAGFWNQFDLELECKDKNQAALAFFDSIK